MYKVIRTKDGLDRYEIIRYEKQGWKLVTVSAKPNSPFTKWKFRNKDYPYVQHA